MKNKNKSKGRVLFVSVLALLLGVLPSGAFAEEPHAHGHHGHHGHGGGIIW